MYIVTELLRGGELYNNICGRSILNEEEAYRIIRPLTECLATCTAWASPPRHQGSMSSMTSPAAREHSLRHESVRREDRRLRIQQVDLSEGEAGLSVRDAELHR